MVLLGERIWRGWDKIIRNKWGRYKWGRNKWGRNKLRRTKWGRNKWRRNIVPICCCVDMLWSRYAVEPICRYADVPDVSMIHFWVLRNRFKFYSESHHNDRFGIKLNSKNRKQSPKASQYGTILWCNQIAVKNISALKYETVHSKIKPFIFYCAHNSHFMQFDK